MSNVNIPLKVTEHQYYCSDINYHTAPANHNTIYDSWKEFFDSWLEGGEEIDFDFNLLFRFDFKEQDEEIDGPGLLLELFFMQQRRGLFVPVTVKNITEDDMPQINRILNKAYEHLTKNIWSEHSS